MKAVIMAGGFGTRLRPITERIPKPCVPVAGVSCIRRIVDSLARIGVTDFRVSVLYLADSVRNSLLESVRSGLNITFCEETVPLGTSGSVKNCLGKCDEDFIVVSGDCVFDFDLRPALEFHRSHGGAVTVISSRAEEPLEYGVMIADGTGRVSRFLEKPDWSRAFSDEVNTGIYLCSPELLDRIPDGVSDFSKDVFPALLRDGIPVYRYAADGYWCDVGTVSSYLECTRKLLSGKETSGVPAVRVNTVIEPPCVIGTDVRLVDCHIGPYTVIGDHCDLSGVRMEGCVLGDRVIARSGVSARNAVICDGCVLEENCRIGDEAVLGYDCTVGAGSTVSAGVRIYPENRIPPRTLIRENVHHRLRNDLPEEGTVLFPFGEDFGGRGFYEIGRVLADLFSGDILIGRAEQGNASASMTLSGGVLARGTNVFDIGVCDLPQFRFAVRNYAFKCGVYFQRNYSNMALRLFDENGMPLSSGMGRKLALRLLEESPCGGADGVYRVFRGGAKAYQTFLRSYAAPDKLMLRVVPSPELSPLLPTATAGEISERMRIEPERVRIEDLHSGEPYDENAVLLCAVIAAGKRSSPVYVPDSFPSVAETVAEREGFRIIRLLPGDLRERKLFPLTDPNVQALLILRLLADRRCGFSQFCASLPDFSVKQREVPVTARRAAVMRALVHAGGELRNGVVFSERGGTVRILPRANLNAFRISTEAADAETAEELCDFYTVKLKGLKPD